ncbi:hypothetical protein CO683_40715 [Bradyrhizobium ottawaense]|uniref:IS66 family insertion sequence element accessory protein TnpB n=1 Tax=Bradyrhizobium ottawaense TaxID=931866 RepID=UPI000BE882A9|nr:hypothetical protein CO683_40715 [Bradyrhizobium ottawaense]
MAALADEPTLILSASDVAAWIATGHTDMRHGMNSLAVLVQQAFKRDPNLCVGRDGMAGRPNASQVRLGPDSSAT